MRRTTGVLIVMGLAALTAPAAAATPTYVIHAKVFVGGRLIGQPILTASAGQMTEMRVSGADGYAIAVTADRDHARAEDPQALALHAVLFRPDGDRWTRLGEQRVRTAEGVTVRQASAATASGAQDYAVEYKVVRKAP